MFQGSFEPSIFTSSLLLLPIHRFQALPFPFANTNVQAIQIAHAPPSCNKFVAISLVTVRHHCRRARHQSKSMVRRRFAIKLLQAVLFQQSDRPFHLFQRLLGAGRSIDRKHCIGTQRQSIVLLSYIDDLVVVPLRAAISAMRAGCCA